VAIVVTVADLAVVAADVMADAAHAAKVVIVPRAKKVATPITCQLS